MKLYEAVLVNSGKYCQYIQDERSKAGVDWKAYKNSTDAKIVFFPAPEAERAVASWQKVKKAATEDVIELLALLGQMVEDQIVYLKPELKVGLILLADALEEAEGE